MDQFAWVGPYPNGLLTIKLVIHKSETKTAPMGPNQVLAPPVSTKNLDNKSTLKEVTEPQINTSVTLPAPTVQAGEDPYGN